jgi:hypothetical protein
MISGLTVCAIVDPWTSSNRAETQSVNANGGPSLSKMLLFTTKRVTETMLSTASRHRWLALYDGVKIGDRVVGYAAEEWSRITALPSLGSANSENVLGNINSRLVNRM